MSGCSFGRARWLQEQSTRAGNWGLNRAAASEQSVPDVPCRLREAERTTDNREVARYARCQKKPGWAIRYFYVQGRGAHRSFPHLRSRGNRNAASPFPNEILHDLFTHSDAFVLKICFATAASALHRALLSMRAAILHGKEDVRVESIAPMALQAGEVRIHIEAALTCGTDLKVFRRGYHAKMIVPPAVFGHELAGVISEVHPETQAWKVGDRVVVANSAPCGRCLPCRNDQQNLCDDLVFLNGAYAESIAVPARLVEKNLLRIQPNTGFRDAALTEPLACVVLGLQELQVKPGQRLLVIGAGPIGLMFLVLAREAGCQVTVAGRGEARLKRALRLGAHAIIHETVKPETVAAVRQKAGAPFDAVVEAVGVPETWEAAVQLVRKGGKVNLFGGCSAGTRISLDTGLIHYSSLTLLASFHHTPKTIRQALRAIEEGLISAKDFVDGECELSKLPDLLRTMATGNRAVKTLIQVHK